MSRSIRSREELIEASNHLFYEIWMFQTLARGMASGIAGEGPINNALLEAFAIHVRGLIGFFYSENPRSDDIIAEDFFSTPDDWINKQPAKTDLLDKAKKRADKEIAHLTYTRLDVSPELKPWEFLKMHNDLDIVVGIFLKNLSMDLLGSRWDETKKKIMAHD